MEKVHKQRFSVLLLLFSLSMVVMSAYGVFYPTASWFLSFSLVNISTFDLPVSMVVDKVSLMFSAVVLLISGCVFMFSRWYMESDGYYYRFTWLLLLFVMSMTVLILSGSIFSLLVGWDGLGISSFLLIIYYQSTDSLRSGFLTLLVNRLGDVLIMSSMFVMVLGGSSLLMNYSPSTVCLLALLFGLAALTKSAQYPFCAWLPAAMAAPTPVSALVHSSTLVTAGIYILVRLCMTVEVPSTVASMFLLCGSMTSLVGGLCAFNENDVKKVIALSTLSQLGVMVFSLGLYAHEWALFHLYTHAMFKALLFLVAGCMLMISYGCQDLRLLGNVLAGSPILSVFLNSSTFCLAGLPFMSAYYSKHSIIGYMLSSSVNLFSSVIMLFALLLSGAYMFRLAKVVSWSTNGQFAVQNSKGNISLYMPMVILFCGSVFGGYLLSIVNINLLCSWYPKSLESTIYVLLVVGVLMGVLVTWGGKVEFLSNMFYMSPTFTLSPNVGYFPSRCVQKFDTGWIEPYTYIRKLEQWFNLLSWSQRWPISGMGFYQYLLFGGVLLYAIWYY